MSKEEMIPAEDEITAAYDRIEELERENVRIGKRLEQGDELISALQDERDALQADNARLRDALQVVVRYPCQSERAVEEDMKQDEFESLSIFEQATITPAYQDGFQAGAASRDAEVVSLTNQRDYEYVRAENAEQERNQFEQERDQLREHVTMLRDVVGHVAGMRFSIVTTKMCEAALAATEPKE